MSTRCAVSVSRISPVSRPKISPGTGVTTPSGMRLSFAFVASTIAMATTPSRLTSAGCMCSGMRASSDSMLDTSMLALKDTNRLDRGAYRPNPGVTGGIM